MNETPLYGMTVWQRADILDLVGPGRYILVVHKDLRDRVLAKYDLKPEDVPGLVVPSSWFDQRSSPGTFIGHPLFDGELGILHGMDIKEMRPPLPRPLDKPTPYPPRKKGRYAR